MSGEIREVTAPASAAEPVHHMSPEGAARLAALQTSGQLPPAKLEAPQPENPPADSTKVTDADGGTANTETGEYTPPARPDQSEAERPAPVEILEQIPEAFVPAKYAEDAAAYRIDAAHIARDANIPAAEMGALYQFIASGVAADLGLAHHDAELQQGQQPGASLRNPDETRQRLLSKYGPSSAEAIMRGAASEFAKLPESVKDWIDAPNEHGDRIGNNPAFVVGLALRAYAKLSPAQAQAELTKLRQEAGYLKGDPLIRDKAAMLGYVIAGSEKQQAKDRQREGGRTPRLFGAAGHGPGQGSGQDVPARVGHQTAAELRAELQALTQKLADPRSEFASDPKKRKAALARRAALMATATESGA